MHRIRTAAATFILAGAAFSAGPAAAVSVTAGPAKQSVAECDSVSSARVAKGRDNGSDPNDLSRAAAAAAEKKMAAKLRAKGLSWSSSYSKKKVTIDVRFHVITKKNGTGGVTKKQLNDQLAVLNAGYGGQTAAQDAPTIFTFVTKSVDYTKNNDWYDWSLEDTDDQDAKAKLHKGGFDDLNVYITGLADGLLGYAYFPFDATLVQDGVVILNESLPGGDAVPYNEGDTLTHEVGHWLGLYHTFENGCTAPGDEVADTPYQADGDNIFNCTESDDTCTAPGKDPVHNFMSYGDDPCLDRFSAGQGKRMALTWFAYRAGGGY